jgi:Thioredoxin
MRTAQPAMGASHPSPTHLAHPGTCLILAMGLVPSGNFLLDLGMGMAVTPRALLTVAIVGTTRAVADNDLRKRIAGRAMDAEKRWDVAATPSFLVNGKLYEGDMSAAGFAKLLGS